VLFLKTTAALSDLMMKAIDEGLEGLVLKDLKVRKNRLEERTIYLQKELTNLSYY
jgi:hypothetical protein